MPTSGARTGTALFHLNRTPDDATRDPERLDTAPVGARGRLVACHPSAPGSRSIPGDLARGVAFGAGTLLFRRGRSRYGNTEIGVRPDDGRDYAWLGPAALISVPRADHGHDYHLRDGWPWLWPDSRETDWVFTFVHGRVWITTGRAWLPTGADRELATGATREDSMNENTENSVQRKEFRVLNFEQTCPGFPDFARLYTEATWDPARCAWVRPV